MSEVLNVELRDDLGKRGTRRLRREGKLPAVLYGHGQGTTHLSVTADEVARLVRRGAKICDLQGSVSESAMIRELQWDTYGVDVLHVDFLRVSSDERITVEVTLQTRGEAPGSKEGGVVKLVVHEVSLETSPANLPEALHLNVNELQLGDSLTLADIEDLPAGAKLLTPPETVAVQCVAQAEETEEETGDQGAAEPELIGRKAEGEESDAE